jgi:hypothetical protein
MLEMVCTDHIGPSKKLVRRWPAGQENAGQGAMCDPSRSDPSGTGEKSREAARRIADQIAPLIRLARANGFDFLAYLLAMALKESRRLSGN